MTTVGDVDDFRHFLPRIFELLPSGEFETDHEVILGKLSYGSWRNWPLREQQAIHEYLLSVWRLSLASPTSPSHYYPAPISDWLCAISRAEMSVAPYLEIWLKDPSSTAAANLVHFVQYHASDLLDGTAPPGYWEDAMPQWRQVVTWLTGASVNAKLVETAASSKDSVLATMAEEVRGVLFKLGVDAG